MPHNPRHSTYEAMPPRSGIMYGKKTGKQYNTPVSPIGRAAMASSGNYSSTLPQNFLKPFVGPPRGTFVGPVRPDTNKLAGGQKPARLSEIARRAAAAGMPSPRAMQNEIRRAGNLPAIPPLQVSGAEAMAPSGNIRTLPAPRVLPTVQQILPVPPQRSFANRIAEQRNPELAAENLRARQAGSLRNVGPGGVAETRRAEDPLNIEDLAQQARASLPFTNRVSATKRNEDALRQEFGLPTMPVPEHQKGTMGYKVATPEEVEFGGAAPIFGRPVNRQPVGSQGMQGSAPSVNAFGDLLNRRPMQTTEIPELSYSGDLNKMDDEIARLRSMPAFVGPPRPKANAFGEFPLSVNDVRERGITDLRTQQDIELDRVIDGSNRARPPFVGPRTPKNAFGERPESYAGQGVTDLRSSIPYADDLDALDDMRKPATPGFSGMIESRQPKASSTSSPEENLSPSQVADAIVHGEGVGAPRQNPRQNLSPAERERQRVEEALSFQNEPPSRFTQLARQAKEKVRADRAASKRAADQQKLNEAQSRLAATRDLADRLEANPLTPSPEDQKLIDEYDALVAENEQSKRDLREAYNAQAGGNNTLFDASDPSQMGSPAPRAPGVDESMRGRFQSRSERDRGVMQPGGMSRFPDSGDDGYRFAGRGATPGVRFDATTYRDRDDQINILTKRAEDHEKAASPDGIEYFEGGGMRYVETDPSSPNFGRAKVVMPEREQTSMQREDLIRRAAARRDGSVYESSDGTVVDFGRLNKNRDAYQKRKQERKDAARELRTRRAQLRNYGITGGATIAPGGGIAGPMTVGTQYRFGPNMSLNQATRIAQTEMDAENRRLEKQQRADDILARQERNANIETYTDLAKTDPRMARQFAMGVGLGGEFERKSDAELSMELANQAAMRENLAENPEAVLDIYNDLIQKFGDDPAELERQMQQRGITPDLVKSAQRRTRPGAGDVIMDGARRSAGVLLPELGRQADEFLENNPTLRGIIGGLIPFGGALGGLESIGGFAADFFTRPSQDELDEEQRRINIRNQQKKDATR